MSDLQQSSAAGFLDRVAALAHEGEFAIRPRVPSIFEPDGLSASADADAAPTEAEPAGESAQPPAPERRAQSDEAGRAEVDAPEPSVTPPRASIHAISPPDSSDSGTETLAPGMPRRETPARLPRADSQTVDDGEPAFFSTPEREPAQHARSDAPALRAVAAPAPQSPDETAFTQPSTGPMPERAAPHTGPDRAAATPEARRAGALEVTEPVAAQPDIREPAPPARSLAAPLSAGEMRVIASLIPERITPPSSQQAARLQNQDVPVVHVTIGRLELHSTPEKSAPRRSTATPAETRKPLSLDDYLRQRGGGR